MNRFRVNLHPAFFFEKTSERPKSGEKEKIFQRTKEDLKKLEDSIVSIDSTTTRRNNETLGTATTIVETKEEKEQTNEDVSKELEKQLKQLAKNKKIDFPWTDNAWKCSRAEKRLATASARVFQQLLDNGKLKDMIEKCKSQKNEDLSKEIAEQWGEELGINSKSKDIIKFYKAFQEYQNSQSEYQHLKNLMGFFCESNFENKDALVASMRTRSQKISKKDIRTQRAELYEEGWEKDEQGNERYVIRDRKTGEEIKHKPKDWKERARFEVIKDRLGNEGATADKMLTLLGDFNLDGEVNSGDVGYKTGSQVIDVFRRTVATKHLEDTKFNDNSAVKNLIDYANKFGMEIENVQSVEQLYKWMTDDTKGYENTKKIQTFIRNLPIELGDVLTNGENAGKESLDHISSALNIEEVERESAEKAATEKTKEFVDKYDSLLKDRIKDATKRANITQQLLSQLPGVLMNEARNMQKGLGVGVAVPLDELVRGLSLGLNVGIDKDGTPRAGIYGGWDHNFNLGKGFDVSTGVSAGLNSFFIPCESLFVELGYDVSEKKRKKTLDATGINRVSLGANCTMYGALFSWGVSGGFEQNKQGGIEKQSKNINGQVKSIARDLLEDPGSNIREGTLSAKLSKKFPKTSGEDLKQATNNILQITSQFKIDEKTTDKEKEIYAQIVADVYTEMWRNDALSGIADNKRKLSGGKVGVQFLAGFVPAITLVTKFTKYYNARTNETEHSRIARIDAQVNGTGNKLIALEGKEVGAEKVNQINDALKKYGAKSELKYVKGENGKIGRIQVPTSIADGIGINIRVSQSMKQYVKKEADGVYSFPANAVYRLLQENGGNQRSVTFNIGSNKSDASDVMISDAKGMEEMIGDKELKGSTKLEYKPAESKGNIENNPEFIKELFTTEVVKGLRTIDSVNWKKFSNFMEKKRNAVQNFNDTVSALTNVLGKDKKYTSIVNKLSDSQVSNEDKQLIIDRVMAISVDTDVHDKKGLDNHVKQRKDYYRRENMKGPNGQPIFKELDIKREDFINELSDYSDKPMSNVLGATAFYNRNLDKDIRGLALTGLGATHVLGGKTKELDDSDKQKVKDWFLGKGENGKDGYVPGTLDNDKSPVERSNLKNVIQSKLPGLKLSDGNIKDLLRGNEITLDNSGKKAKVKLDVKYVFYLMGECANESVGMELGDIQVQEQHEVDDYRQGELYLNNGDGSNSVNVSRRDFAAGVTLGGGNKGGKNEGDNNGKVKTEGEYEDTGELPSTHPQVNGQDDTKIGEIPVGQGENSGNELGEL